MKSNGINNNPLLQNSSLPKFDQIAAQHFENAVKIVIKTGRSRINKLLMQKRYTWCNFVAPFEIIEDQSMQLWSLISHINSVNGTKKIRESYQKTLSLFTDYVAKIAQDRRIYRAFKQIATAAEFHKLNSTQQKIIDDHLRNCRLAGATLAPSARQHLLLLNQKLAKLGHKFSCNVLDATQRCAIKLNKREVRGLPEHILALGKVNATKHNYNGWLFRLDYQSYHALITHADSRNVRKDSYIKYVTRATKDDATSRKFDNDKIIVEILKTRTGLAKLLGFENYAEYSLESKMAKDNNQVLSLLNLLATKTMPKAIVELKELSKFAQKQGIKKLAPWDISYYEEKLSRKKYSLDREKLRNYFPLERVLCGMFSIVHRLYGIHFKECHGIAVLVKDVRFFEVYDDTNKLLGQFYFDPYSRENKQSGAWMSSYRSKHRLSQKNLQLPVAFLITNFLPPNTNKPTLITHDDLLTLLHEFGHVLQHLLTKIEYLGASGINGIPWDAIEIISQLMENWGWQEQSLRLMSQHYKTGKPLPARLLNKLVNARKFHAALQMLRQIELSLVDFMIHMEVNNINLEKMHQIVSRIQRSCKITPHYRGASILNTFSHIFAGAYAAGYYSYKWADLLAQDIFSRFKSAGIFSKKTGRDLLASMLETGGSADPMVLFKKFMGRDPKIESLLTEEGII